MLCFVFARFARILMRYMKASHHLLLSFAGASVTYCSDIQPPMGECNHEEADTRIVVHIQHALQNGARWDRCVSYSYWQVPRPCCQRPIARYMGSFWDGSKLLLHQHQHSVLKPRTRPVQSLTSFSCIYWF